jgi:hypothetical protein
VYIAPSSVIGEETHLKVFDIQGKPHGIYTGEPRPELDQAWRDLLQCECSSSTYLIAPLGLCSNVVADNNIRVSEDWVKRQGREHEAVHLPDRGYLGMLSVFHELHCIASIWLLLLPLFPSTQVGLNESQKRIKRCIPSTTSPMHREARFVQPFPAATASSSLKTRASINTCTLVELPIPVFLGSQLAA